MTWKAKQLERIQAQLNEIEEGGFSKEEKTMTTPQQVKITANSQKVLNFCANNYLGLAQDPDIIKIAKKALDDHGYGMASVRFICGTQDIHLNLEKKLSNFLEKEDTILYSSCFDANGGLFEAILTAEDAVISDELNHASIIDGIRLCKAKRYRYANNDLKSLEEKLQESQSSRLRLICTDGVFSMDGIIADLQGICELAHKYQALVMVDDSHGVGVLGTNGRGSPEHCEVLEQVDIITGTLGKALGGASGGYTSGPKEIIDLLRQRSRPYLFSNSLAPVITASSLHVLETIQANPQAREKLRESSQYFRQELSKLGFELSGSDHPIIPVMIGEARLAKEFARRLYSAGIYAVSFSFPVVPRGKARIRTQLSAAHERTDLDKAIAAFAQIGRELELIS